MSSLKKEKCVSCEKFINIGQCITECAKCLNVIHSRFFSKSNFKQANEKYYCEICHSLILLRYNPFKKLNDEINSDSEQTFNENPCSYTGDLTEASQVLDKCEILNLNMSLNYSMTTKITLTLISTTSMELNQILMFLLQN